MANRKTPIAEGEYYHIYNRGVDKRVVFKDRDDLMRFHKSVLEFNTLRPIGSLYLQSFKSGRLRKDVNKEGKLVKIVAYCFNPNHYHFLMSPAIKGGLEKFMQKLGTGYTNYFNDKNNRSGALFQGKYKSSHIETNDRLLVLSAYINLNYKIHKLRSSTPKLSSLEEYTAKAPTDKDVCNDKSIILKQFDSTGAYKKFADNVVEEIIEDRDLAQREEYIDL